MPLTWSLDSYNGQKQILCHVTLKSAKNLFSERKLIREEDYQPVSGIREHECVKLKILGVTFQSNCRFVFHIRIKFFFSLFISDYEAQICYIVLEQFSIECEK